MIYLIKIIDILVVLDKPSWTESDGDMSSKYSKSCDILTTQKLLIMSQLI